MSAPRGLKAPLGVEEMTHHGVMVARDPVEV